jgi:hypothetical protein
MVKHATDFTPQALRTFGEEIRGVGNQIIRMAGHFLTHGLGILLLCWRRMSRAALITFGGGFVLVEIVGTAFTGHFPAPVLTHVVALIFALVAAYAVALTVFIDELFVGSIDLIRVLQGDMSAGARALAIATERRAGEAGGGIMRWLGVRPQAQQADAQADAVALPEWPAGAQDEAVLGPEDQWKQTQADIDATDEFLTTAPRPRVNARPVQASQLPRIEWALENLEPETRSSPPPEVQLTAARVTRPITRPLSVEESPEMNGQRSIWSRISKTLVGNVHPPADDVEEATPEIVGTEEA